MANSNPSPKRFALAAAAALALASAASARFPVIGYFPSWAGSGANLQYDKLTHIMYSFVTTQANGTLSSVNDARVKELVRLGHAKGTKIGIAVGGWSAGTANFSAMAANPTSRAAFIRNLVALCDQYDLDGVDMDWEYPDANSAVNFKTMMKELKEALAPKGRFLSTAVIASGGTGNHIHKEVFDHIDYLNIMSYDGGGQNHSSYELAVNSLNYWVDQRGCPKAKAILGVPFYGKNPATAYKTLLQQDPQAHSKDNVGSIYYNGIPTLQRKTDLAHARGGGIMIWEISQDVNGEHSLLSAIHQKASAYPVSVAAPAARAGAALIAGPGHLRWRGATAGPYDLLVHAAGGALVRASAFRAAAGEGTFAWDASGLPAGVYVLSMRPAGAGSPGSNLAFGSDGAFVTRVLLTGR